MILLVGLLQTIVYMNLVAEHQTFNSKKHFQFAISMWHIKKNREYVVKDSSKQKLRVKCKDPDCEWRLYAKSIGNAKA
jgi:MuDR family transposase